MCSTSALLRGVYRSGLSTRVRGEGDGVWPPGDPNGLCRSSQRTAGGGYSDNIVVPP